MLVYENEKRLLVLFVHWKLFEIYVTRKTKKREFNPSLKFIIRLKIFQLYQIKIVVVSSLESFPAVWLKPHRSLKVSKESRLASDRNITKSIAQTSQAPIWSIIDNSARPETKIEEILNPHCNEKQTYVHILFSDLLSLRWRQFNFN